ncbi:MAG: hypothetical protein ABSD97_00315 [Acidimicrobiales bacterium]|jgi:hypothetical protein
MRKLARGFKLNRVVTGAALLASAALLAAGCGNSSSGSTTTTTGPAASSTTTTSPSSAKTTTTKPAPPTTTSAASLGSSLLAKFQAGEHATFLANYKITSGATKELTSLTIGEQSPDSIFKGVTSSGTFEWITAGTKSDICSETGSTWSCFSAGAGDPEAALFDLYQPSRYLPDFEAYANSKGAHTSFSSMTVSGYPLSCITVSGLPDETGSGTFCVTAQGVLGYVSWTGATAATSGSFEITSYSTSVPAGEFTLPATPTKLP